MTNLTTKLGHAGLDALTERPLLTSIWRRRTHRVSRGSSIEAGSMSWTSSEPRTPLTELEEAVLISLTGCRDEETGAGLMLKPSAEDEYNHGEPSVVWCAARRPQRCLELPAVRSRPERY